MHVYLLGAEQPSWRDTLLENGATHIGLSYWSLCRRTKSPQSRAKPLADRFPDDHDLLLESGGFQANADPERMSLGDWEAYAVEYITFAVANQERCTLITEFDCLALGNEWIEEMRRKHWSQVDPAKFLPVWHPTQGLAALDRLADRYPLVSVVESVVTERGSSVAPQLRKLMQRGVRTHGAALTKPETIDRMPFDTVASSSWISPTRWGDTILWDGRRLHRYPNRMKDTARGGRHKAWLEQNGFDTEALLADQNAELTRLSVWSWLEWASSVPERRLPSKWEPRGTQTPRSGTADETVGGNAPDAVSASSGEVVPARPRERVLLPVIGFATKEVATTTGGTASEMQMVMPDTSVRVCDTCLITNCEMREAGASCAFKFPVEMRTRGQAQAVRKGILEMMVQRVGFMRYNEERSGGYADENLDRMLDRLWKALQADAEIEDERDFVKLSLEGRGSSPSGLMSALFGREVGERSSRLPEPVGPAGTDRIIEGSTSHLLGNRSGG